MKIKNRKELAQYFNERMTKSYFLLKEEKKLDVDSTLVKTYLLEAHNMTTDKPLKRKDLLNSVRLIFNSVKSITIKNAIIEETQEEALFHITLPINKEPIDLYIDTTNIRFWLIHSMNSSRTLDFFITKLLSESHLIDSAWLPIQLLEYSSKLGSFRGLGLDYDRREVKDIDFESLPVEFMKMQLWGNRAKEVLETLRKEGAFPDSTTLSKVKIKYWLGENKDQLFTLDDIKYNGKITARGTSFESHINLVTDIYRKYSRQILDIEKKYSLSTKTINSQTDNGYVIDGYPINFVFKNSIKNLEKFCNSLFNGSSPFKLWGIPLELNKKFYSVKAVDLHVGCRINFEINPEFIRIYLPKSSCGNTIARLFTNFQHYYDPLVETEIGEDESTFKY